MRKIGAINFILPDDVKIKENLYYISMMATVVATSV